VTDPARERLLFVSTSSGLGGSEKMLARLALAEQPLWEAVGLCSLKPPGDVGRQLARQGLALSSCGLREGRGPAGVLSTLAAIPSLLRAAGGFRPTVIHAFLFRAGLLARAPILFPGARARQQRPRLIVSIRRVEERSRLLHLLDRFTASAVDAFTAVSEAARLRIALRSGIPPERIEVIPNGVEVPGPVARGIETSRWRQQRRAEARRRLESILGRPLQATLVGSAGRLEPVKDHRLLLEAVARLIPRPSNGRRPPERPSGPEQGPGMGARDLGLVLIGEGSERRALESAASLPPLNGRVHLAGERQDLLEILPAFDLFALPSRSEGMSNALLEAMAEGIPVIATRAGGSAEVVENHVSGLLVEPREPAALAGAIAGLLASPERAWRLGAAGRERVRERFSLDAMLARYRALYARLLSRP
jgi:glycosyltransferase involved in cell wall biosynthesis